MPNPDPRPLSAPAKRRAWAELPVRAWLAMTVCLLVAAIILASTRIGAYVQERRVVETGTPVEGVITAIGMSGAREGSRDEVQHVTLRYTPPGGTQPLEADGDLPRKPESMISLKDVLHVKIDPNAPRFWTERDAPPPVSTILVTPALCLMVGVLSFFIAWMRRNRVLRVAARGERVTGRVVSVKQSPLAPMSKQIGLTLAGEDRRVLHCYWPARLGAISPGQEVEVLVDPPRALVAALYAQA